MPKTTPAKLGASDTPALTPASTYGIDYLTLSLQTSSPQAANAQLCAILDAMRAHDSIGDVRDRNGYAGHEILGARGYAGTRREWACLDLPGQAIEALRLRGIDDAELLKLAAPWRASRVDFSVDTINPEINPELVSRTWHAGHVTCRAGEIRELKQTRADGKYSHTVYIGSSKSMRMLRVYDKRTQMEFVHRVTSERPWTRFELQHRHQEADAAVKIMAERGPAAGLSLMNGWITFHDPRARATRLLRRPQAAWWTEIVETKKVRSV